MKASVKWLGTYLLCVLLLAGLVIRTVVQIDPFMHYHKPLTEEYFYTLDNQRSQNDGITRHFEYDAVMTGTSMMENLRTSDADEIFGDHFIKVPYSGGSFKEINDNLAVALQTHPHVRTVVRTMDMTRFFSRSDAMRTDLGEFPTYLYNRNPVDDIYYVFNRDVLYARCGEMIRQRRAGKKPGITSFDEYSNWMRRYTFGKNTVLASEIKKEYRFGEPLKKESLTDEERETIRENIRLNVTELADRYPGTDFYYFMTPYSAVWWGYQYEKGTLDKQIDAEEYILGLILPHKNIHLYSWNDKKEITTNLNFYKDSTHYGEWVGTWMLRQMKAGRGLLTEENYREYIAAERALYRGFAYNSLFDQEDYEDDSIAETLLKQVDARR